MRLAWAPLLAVCLLTACGSDKPSRHSAKPRSAVRANYVAALADVERQLGCGIVKVAEEQGHSRKHVNRFLRRMANAYAKASRRLSALRPPANAVAPNANLAKSLSGVADALRLGPVGLTDQSGRFTDKGIADAFLPPAADKALEELRAAGYPGRFTPSNCDDTDLFPS
jgi:hypothetical protein